MNKNAKIIDEPARTNMSDRCALAKTRGMFGAILLAVGLFGLAIVAGIHVFAWLLNPVAMAILAVMFFSGIYTVWLVVATFMAAIGATLKYLEIDDCKAAEYYAIR